jgi:hypothetical protein
MGRPAARTPDTTIRHSRASRLRRLLRISGVDAKEPFPANDRL